MLKFAIRTGTYIPNRHIHTNTNTHTHTYTHTHNKEEEDIGSFLPIAGGGDIIKKEKKRKVDKGKKK